jgi:hypothetical protein
MSWVRLIWLPPALNGAAHSTRMIVDLADLISAGSQALVAQAQALAMAAALALALALALVPAQCMFRLATPRELQRCHDKEQTQSFQRRLCRSVPVRRCSK